jgi:RNA polymerase sigma factor (sigma-70 family)
VRSQFHHVIDVAPTALEAAKIPQPKVVNGVNQRPMDGVSMLYSFDAPQAPERRTTQYFEMFGNRGIYHEGWVACTQHSIPWEMSAKLPALKDDGKFATWLCGIVRNVSVDLARRRTRDERHRDVRSRFRDEAHDPISEIESREQSIHIDQALWRLDDVSRTMVVLRYYENLPSDRIADLLATTPAAVDMRLSRARQTLRCLLEPANEDVTR